MDEQEARQKLESILEDAESARKQLMTGINSNWNDLRFKVTLTESFAKLALVELAVIDRLRPDVGQRKNPVKSGGKPNDPLKFN